MGPPSTSAAASPCPARTTAVPDHARRASSGGRALRSLVGLSSRTARHDSLAAVQLVVAADALRAQLNANTLDRLASLERAYSPAENGRWVWVGRYLVRLAAVLPHSGLSALGASVAEDFVAAQDSSGRRARGPSGSPRRLGTKGCWSRREPSRLFEGSAARRARGLTCTESSGSSAATPPSVRPPVHTARSGCGGQVVGA